jgi:hypothetical protein
MAKGHSLRGVRVVILPNVNAGESQQMLAEHEKLEILSGSRRVR